MRVDVVSPWYPDAARPYAGAFVAAQVDALRHRGHEVSVEVPLLYPAPRGNIPPPVRAAIDRLAAERPEAMFNNDGDICYVPSLVPTGSSQLARANVFASSLQLKREVLPGGWDVTHAHLGVPTGKACLDLGNSPLIVTEHQSQLPTLLGEPGFRSAYSETVRAADAFIAVSNVVKRVIVQGLGSWSEDRIEVVPNIVDLSSIPFTDRDSNSFSRWLYVGGLFTHKGIPDLVKAFARFKARIHSEASLTLVGEGPARSWIEGYARRKGMAGAVDLVGAVPPANVSRYLGSADLFVHLSPYETFGISTLEAIGAGLPVISIRNGGADESWGDLEERCGVLLPRHSSPGDVVAAVVALEARGTLDPRGARQAIEERFAPSVVAGRLEEIYMKCAR